jgi:hypothetical protein
VTLTISPVPRASGSLLHVYLEDTTYADAPARVLLHTTRPADPPGDGTLVIDIDPPAIPENVVCTVRAHVDLDGDNAISAGDYITMETYLLADSLVMRLHRVP